MQPAPDIEEFFPENLRLALREAHQAYADMVWGDLRDIEETYARYLEAAVSLSQVVPKGIRQQAIEFANGQARPTKVEMNTVVPLVNDYDNIDDALLSFFQSFGEFRREFTRNGSVGTLVWASKSMSEALLECSSFYHTDGR